MAVAPQHSGTRMSLVNKDGESFDIDVSGFHWEVTQCDDGIDVAMWMPPEPWEGSFESIWRCPSWYCRLKRWLKKVLLSPTKLRTG